MGEDADRFLAIRFGIIRRKQIRESGSALSRSRVP
jgi:hypothetical protein